MSARHSNLPGYILTVVAIWLLAPSSRAAQSDEAALPAHVRLQDVGLPDERAKIVSSLQESLDQIGFDAKISDCALMLDYFDDAGSGRDSSYGADCTVRSAKGSESLVLCDDWLVGKFTLAPGAMAREQLGRFIRNNCPPAS